MGFLGGAAGGGAAAGGAAAEGAAAAGAAEAAAASAAAETAAVSAAPSVASTSSEFTSPAAQQPGNLNPGTDATDARIDKVIDPPTTAKSGMDTFKNIKGMAPGRAPQDNSQVGNFDVGGGQGIAASPTQFDALSEYLNQKR